MAPFTCSLLLVCLCAAAAAPLGDPLRWFFGCVDAGGLLDPLSRCGPGLDGGFNVAALTSDKCYCVCQLQGLRANACVNASSNEGSQEVRRGQRAGNLPLGRREGPILRHMHVSIPQEKSHAGKAFVLEVCGKLAGCLDQVTGIPGLGGPAYITVEFFCGTPECQSSQQVNVSHAGSFAVSYQRILEASAKHGIEVTVSKPISKRCPPRSFCVLPPPSAISPLHGRLLPRESSRSGTTQASNAGDAITPRAYVADGPAAQLRRSLSHGERDQEVGVERTCEGPNSSLVLTRPTSPDLRVSAPDVIDRAVSVDAASRAVPTNTDVAFLAVTDVPEPLEFLWNFGDSTNARTSTTNVTKRYHAPGRYNVTVMLSDGHTSFTSGVLSVFVQRAVKLNKLFHGAFVLRNRTATVSCRVNSGTDVAFLWNFGDGTTRPGRSTEQHVFLRTGEFQMEVTVSNRVSSASLSSIIFVLDRPCQPPPVKNTGPLKLQVRRHDVLHLGVSYEADVECGISTGLHYTWTMLDSAGHILPVPDAHKQRLVLPGHLLDYDTYTATAKVKVVGSVVYSNYSVRIQVMPSPLVASIQGGTNIFINNRNITMVTLDGRHSYNPDFPMNPVSVKWTCEPVSSIKSSCFNRHVATYSPVLAFPASSLKDNFDQFRFTLTVHSGNLSALTEAFVTLTPNVVGRLTVSCTECEGDQVNWDQSISVKAICEGCEVPPNSTQYIWTFHMVNTSSKPVVEVPFCYMVDLSAPATIRESTSMSAGLAEPVHGASPTTIDPAGTAVDGSVHLDQREIGSKLPLDYDSSTDWDSADTRDGTDYDAPLQITEEGDPGISAGRPTGVDVQTSSPGDDLSFNPASHDPEGSNLLEYSPGQVIREQTLLDLPRDLVEAGLFASYTYTGVSSALLSFRPFSLKPGSMYMLEIIAKSQRSILGRTQLFLRTKPVPKGMTCQVQPSKGVELYTHFSIFCTSGREDLLYEYSFSVGSEPPRMLYRGRNFEYYFSLPSGHPNDDYKVTVYTQIRSSMYGSSSKVCPVTIQVLPSFFRNVSANNPDVELSQSGLKNLSALIVLGNSAEIRNYVSLLSGILNRLSLDGQADHRIQRRIRSVLICTVCELESSDQDSMVDNMNILKDLLQVTRQVTLASVVQVAAHVQAISATLSRPSAPKRYRLDRRTLDTLVSVLSYSLEAAVTARDAAAETSYIAESQCETAFEPQTGVNPGKDVTGAAGGDLRVTQQLEQLVENILHTASELILKHTLLSRIQERRVRGGLLSLFSAHQNLSIPVISSGSAVFYIPAPLIHSLRGECVLSLIAELKRSPWIRAPYPGRISGPVVDLTLYKCSTRRQISFRSLVQPIIVEMQPRQDKKDSAHEHTLLRNSINYHSFNITQEHLQQAIQLSVAFMLPLDQPFPIMLLFRMFAKPAPSMHHLQRIHLWETNTTRITLPPSYLNAPGVGYLALLNSDFGKPVRHKHLSSQIMYTLAVDASQCLSLDRPKGAWTRLACSTHQADRTDAVNCSCHQLRTLTVVRKQIQSSFEAADLDPFLSESTDATVLVVVLLLTCLYIPAFAKCRRADVISEQNPRVHYLNDNCRSDPHLYAVTIHTGLCSAHRLSAKVYIALHGGDGISQTRELYVPGCTLFRRNSRDTFILSAADSLGPVWGVHIWHDNSGPSPHFYLKLVEIREVGRVNKEARTWLFASQCWLSVSKGDGRVGRMLRVCTRAIGRAQMLRLRLCDDLADFHMWMSVYSCPQPHSFTHMQRLSVCLLLFAGYACVNALIISQMDEALHFEVGITAVSAVSLTTGVLSAVSVLPTATLITLLFRMHDVKLVMAEEGTQTDQDSGEVNDTEAFKKKYQDADKMVTKDVHNKDSGLRTDVIPKQMGLQEQAFFKGGSESGCFDRAAWFEHSRHLFVFDKLRWRKVACRWCYYAAWTLCLLLSIAGLVLAALLGLRFGSNKPQLWLHSLFISLLLCNFVIQPIVILAVSVTVSIWYRNRVDFHRLSGILLKAEEQRTSALQSERCLDVEKLLGQRHRARFLRLVCPATAAELRPTRGHRRREALIRKTLRDLCFSVALLLLMSCISHGSSFSDHYRLHKAVRQQFAVGGEQPSFMPIQKYEDWWKWTQSSLLHLLYKNPSAAMKSDVFQRSYVLIGEPVVWTTQLCRKRSSTCPPCAHLGCNVGPNGAVRLGHARSDATSRRKASHCRGCTVWKAQFTLYSPAPDLFTAVTLLAEQSPAGTPSTSATVQSAKVYHTPTVWDYVVSVCQLLFLCLSPLHLCVQVGTAWQKGPMGYRAALSDWLHATIRIVIFIYSYHDVYRSAEAAEVVELLQRNDGKQHVDVSLLAAREQLIRSLRGLLLLLLAVKCVTTLRLNGSATRLACSFPNLVSAVLLLPVVRSLHTLLCNSSDPKAIGGLLHYERSSPSLRTVCLSCALVMTAVRSSAGGKRRRSRKEACALTELSGYIRRRVRELAGREGSMRPAVERKTYYLEEFESLVDELLLRLTRLNHTLARVDHHVPVDPLHEPTAAQNIARTHSIEPEPQANGPTRLSRCEDATPASHLRSAALPQPSGRGGQSESMVEELQSGQAECHSVLSGALERQTNLTTRTSARFLSVVKCRTTTEATHAEELVEVLIHDEPF
ncbi:polycystin-1-like protein 1 [Phyllopteryx taeniolatus]|uniref:polycystin-1-like protein 1 n=1 Tax=Phyllopteryx taeniolatus TaxID=161469 RepID=UPI002AD3FB1B|nr:polycystin-1-like protein 1 [Phyllopteryx taeniolatus]